MSKFLKDLEFTFTGTRYGTEGNDEIDAYGFGGTVYAGGGHDDIIVGAVAAIVYTGIGNDWVTGGAAYLNVIDDIGDLEVKGLTAWSEIEKSGHGNLTFKGASAAVHISHTGYEYGNIKYSGAAAANLITRKGQLGDVKFAGVGGYNKIWHETNSGNLKFDGAGFYNKLTRTWLDKYQNSDGNIDFTGAGGKNEIRSRVESGDINFTGAGAKNILERKGKLGNINIQGAGADNQIIRTSQSDDIYKATRGNINFEGVGGGNNLYSNIAHGNITFEGGGFYNKVTRTGQRNSRKDSLFEYDKAEDIALVSAEMKNLESKSHNQVSALKSLREPNTYLFKTPGWPDTNLLQPDYGRRDYTFNKVKVYNDPKTGKLQYDSELWRINPTNGYIDNSYDLKMVNDCWNKLETQDIVESHRFTKISTNSDYQLSDLKIALHKRQVKYKDIAQHGVIDKLLKREWSAYGSDLVVDAADVKLGDARIIGAVSDGSVAARGFKSNLKLNTYIYAAYHREEGATRIIECELDNDPDTCVLRYRLKGWYKNESIDINDERYLANLDLSLDNGFHRLDERWLSLNDVNYQIDKTETRQERIAHVATGTKQDLFKFDHSMVESSGDINFTGIGGGNVIKSNVVRGNVNFNGGGIANIITHESAYGDTNFVGGGAANIIVKNGRKGDLIFKGGGLANVLLHQSEEGKMDVNAGGALNVLIRIGDGEYKAHLAALGNISIQQGEGDSRIMMLGGLNTHTQMGSSRRNKALWRALGGFNLMTQIGGGNLTAILAGGANVLTKIGEDDLNAVMLGGANIVTHISDDENQSNTHVIALGGLNILTKKGRGDVQGIMGGGANVLTHIGNGNTLGIMLGGANILTKVGDGHLSGIMLGIGNVLTHVGDGRTLGVMGAVGNIFTKVGHGTSIAAMVGGGNIFTHVGEGDAWALMGGLGNVYTKVGAGNALALMIAKGNVFTHVGDGMSVALMLAKGNIATKVGNGMTLAAMIGGANIFTHVGNGETFAVMVGKANILTKVGSGLTVGLMLGKANIYTHVGDSTSIGLFAGEANIMTKVGDGTTLAVMFGKANIMTHVGNELTGVLALGEANIVTKVGNGFMGVIAAAKGNLVTHVGNGITAAVLGGKGNLLTKVGDGTTVGLLISDMGNIMTHVGGGTTVGFAKGKANIITKVGSGLGINAAWGKANIFTHVGDGDRYNFAKGDVNLITRVGNGQEISVVQGKANVITHVGDGNNYTGAWGTANIVTQVGDGRQVTLAKGDANIVTLVGQGDSYSALWGKANISTKVGNGTQVTVAKGQANVTTTVGDGLGVTATYGDININTKVGNGVSVNVAWGKYNVNTKVGNGLNVAVMKGKANANIHVGDGLAINASYAQNNVMIKIGNGDVYNLSVASSNTNSSKLASLFGNIKQSLLGSASSQAINYVVQGDDATTSGSRQGKGAINLTGKPSIDGFKMEKVDEIKSDIGDKLTASITDVETPDLSNVSSDESSLTHSSPNLIVNGEFEHEFKLDTAGWHLVRTEDEIKAISQYGQKEPIDLAIKESADIEDTFYSRPPSVAIEYEDKYEPDIAMYQDINGLMQDDTIVLSFDFERKHAIPSKNKLSVIWNGKVVFTSSSEDRSIAWQQQVLKLAANAESNRLIFKITGKGTDYRLKNVVAKSSSANINKHISNSDATKNALTDKDNANANRQKLADEKQRQLESISSAQTKLESTDQVSLDKNGQIERDAVREEAESVTHNLTSLAQELKVLNSQAQSVEPSGQQWRDQFAGGILDGVQQKLDDAKLTSSTELQKIQSSINENRKRVKAAIAKSEAGVTQSEKYRQGAEQDIAKAKADAAKRNTDALSKKNDAERAEKKALTAVTEAELRGNAETESANNKAFQAQKEAKSVKQEEGDKPNRRGSSGSGLSGKGVNVEGAGEVLSHIDNTPITQGDGRFSKGLTDDELELLDDAQQAVNRLSINAGIRQKSGNTLPSPTPNYNGQDLAINQVPSLNSGNLQRHEIGAIAVNLAGLGEKPSFDAIQTKFNIEIHKRNKRFVLVLKKYSKKIKKNIYLDDINDPTQQKIIEHFILANYAKFELMPDELHLTNDTIKSSHNKKDRILAEYVGNKWQMLSDSLVMSVDELRKVAGVKGKIQGESYESVIKALTEYHKKESSANYSPIERLQALVQLRTQIAGYQLGHPNSERNDGLKQLQVQVDTRYKHASALIQDSHYIHADSSFSRLYDQLSNANLKRSKHIYVDANGNFVTKGKDNLQGQDTLISGKNAIGLVKSTVEKEYGADVANRVFSQFADNELAENGRGIDVTGLKKIHRAIEQEVSPFSATLYIWRPSNYSQLGHATLQIGQGRLQLDTDETQNSHKENYVSWWPKEAKSLYEMGQPALPKESLALDIKTEEDDDFGLDYKYKGLDRFDRLMETAKGKGSSADNLSIVDADNMLKLPNYLENSNIPRSIGQPFLDEWNAAKTKRWDIAINFMNSVQGKFSGNEITIDGAKSLLTDPDLLQKRKIPLSVAQPFIDQWNDINTQIVNVPIRLLEAMKTWIQEGSDPTLTQKRIDLVAAEFSERGQNRTDKFKANSADEGRVFRINLEGLDVAAMQEEWKRIKNDPDGRYTLLTKNCSSIVARVLKAGGADELIGHNWRPRFGVWTPNQMFKFAQVLQEAQMARQQSRAIPLNLQALPDSENTSKKQDNEPPFVSVERKLNIVFSEDDAGFLLKPESDDTIEKFIYMKDKNSQEQQKIISDFILAHYNDFDVMPEQLFLLDDKITSLDGNKTRILSEKIGDNWQPVADSKLMSVDELTNTADVTGKVRGESYKTIIKTLADYYKKESDTASSVIDRLQNLVELRTQIDGYLLKHPDSDRNHVLKQLREQADIRYKHDSALTKDSQKARSDSIFTRLYDQFSNANLKSNKHIYLDANNNFVTKGKDNLQGQDKLISGKNAIEHVKSAVEKEYGAEITHQVFSQFTDNELAKNGQGIDLSGLKKIHRSIEQLISPIGATLYIWKPSKHSSLGHAALQIGSGRLQLDSEGVQDNHNANYVSWWPLGNKSSTQPFNVSTEDNPDLRLRWYDLSQPARRDLGLMTLKNDIESEEKTDFKLGKGDAESDKRLKRFHDNINPTKGFDKITPAYAAMLLQNDEMLSKSIIPHYVMQPFIKEWAKPGCDPQEVSTKFAAAVKTWVQETYPPAVIDKRFANEVSRVKAFEEKQTDEFKTNGADEGAVFRINLEGLDAAAMQKEWKRISSDSDGRYQLLTKNCSSMVARVLKAGGADKLIGHNWKPRFGVWTPNELFKFSQKLQEAQLAQIAIQQSKSKPSNLQALSDPDKVKRKVAIDNDRTPPNEKKVLSPLTRFFNDNLYGTRDKRREMTGVIKGNNVEKTTLKGDAGRLTGHYHKGNNSIQNTADKKVVLFLHGSNSPVENQASSFHRNYNQQGIDMLSVNMRGFGGSDGTPNEAGMYADAQTMFRYLVNDRGVDPKNIIIHGYSMGAPIAAKLAADVSAKGQRIAGLFLDRPMPSVSKLITAHGLFNLVGQIAKKLNGQFSVEKNLQGLPKDVPIMLMTDSEGLGNEGEKMRIKLVADGYRVAGENTPYEHTDSHAFMNEYVKQVVSGLLEPEKQALGTTAQKPMKKNKVTGWDTVNVKPNVDGGDSRFDGQIIIQTEDDPIAAKAAAALAAKHHSNSVVVQLDTDGNYRVVHGDPTQLSGKVRWQLVGHGREESENNHLRLSSYNADELAIKLVKFNTEFSTANKIKATPDHISIVGCSLIGDDKQTGFARQFITALDQQGIHTEVSARVTEVAVDAEGHKYTKDSNGEWAAKKDQNKVVLGWDEKGKVTTQLEQIRNGVAEGDIDITKVGDLADNKARGTIADNDEVFTAPKKRNLADQTPPVVMNSQLSYSGNIQVNVGNGEFTSVNWGTSNLGIKVGTGGFKSLAFGDNNVMVHIGNGESKHSVNIAGYQAFEGAQLFIGTRNVSFNLGRSNDLIVMLEKSIPTPPLVNPFDGAARIAGVLESIARSGNDTDWLAAQDEQWTLASAKKFAADMSGLDQTSSVDYKTLTDLDAQNKRSSRGVKSDLEATLNKKYNQWLGRNGNKAEMGTISRADKFRQLNEKVAFNFAVGGQGADIQVTTGNWNLMFGDNIQSIMDTNLGSLFGLMTQQFTASGMAKTTFTYSPADLPRQLKNKLLGRLAGVSSDTTLGDIFGVDYTADGKIVSRSGAPVDGAAILKEMLTVVTDFGGEQLAAFTDPTKLIDNLQSSINMGKDGITSFAKSHGLKKKAPEDQQDKSTVSVNGQNTSTAVSSAEKGEVTSENDRVFGFNALNMPNLFATIFNKDKQAEMRKLVENIKENLVADLLNMEKKTFDFLRNSGHLKGDGDMHVSLGNYNFNWGGDGSDLGAYLGDNNNFWGGRGADAFYATGTSNIFTGGEGSDLGVLMGRENTMFGGKGDDIAVVAGRVNHVYLGEGNDQAFVFGEGGEIHANAGNDYVVITGNYNRIFSGSEQDFVVTIGNRNQIALEEGDDFAKIFGNYNSLKGGNGNDEIQLMGYHAVVNGNEGNDRLIAASISKFSTFDGGAGNDVIVLGGYQNNFKGGMGIDSFLINGNVINCHVDDISQEDNIVLGGIDWNSLWFERSGYDLKISHIRTPQGVGDQAAFERIGSTTFTDYFNGNRAKVVIAMTDKAASGEREYAALSTHSLDMQIQAMSAFPPKAGASGFFDNVSGEAKQTIAAAWADMVRGKGILA